jgi:hypothetical protein
MWTHHHNSLFPTKNGAFGLTIGKLLDTLSRRFDCTYRKTEMSKWLAAPRKRGRETQSHSTTTYQHHGNCQLLEGHHARTEEMADKNEPEICTSRKEHQ